MSIISCDNGGGPEVLLPQGESRRDLGVGHPLCLGILSCLGMNDTRPCGTGRGVPSGRLSFDLHVDSDTIQAAALVPET